MQLANMTSPSGSEQRHKSSSIAGMAWTLVVPMLLLPNLGPVYKTQFGVFLLGDLLVVPLILCLLVAAPYRVKLEIGIVSKLLIVLASWAALTISVSAWQTGLYDLQDEVVGMAKLLNLSLYGLAGILFVRTMNDPINQTRHYWVLTTAALIAGLGLLAFRGPHEKYNGEDWYVGYTSNNGISVILAILIAYLSSVYLQGMGSQRWRRLYPLIAVIVLLGLLMSSGRGGWFALAGAALYIAIRLGLFTPRVIFASFLAVIVSLTAYITQEPFREEVNETLFAQADRSVEGGSMLVGGVNLDTGSRGDLVREYMPRILDDPIFGQGYRVISQDSNFGFSESHNFWLQMFLETGIVGGALTFIILFAVWRLAGKQRGNDALGGLPIKASLVAIILAGLTEVYFFSGLALFFALATLAPLGFSATTHPHLSSNVPPRPVAGSFSA